MSVRIGAALRRELPALGEVRSHDAAFPDVAGEELALRMPLPATAGRPAAMPLSTPAPPRPSFGAMAAVGALVQSFADPRELAALGDAAAPVRGMVESLNQLLGLSRQVGAIRQSRAQG